MPKIYQNINYNERCQISTLLKVGLSIGTIARELDRDRTAIHRKIKRNAESRGTVTSSRMRRQRRGRHAALCAPRRFTSKMRTKADASQDQTVTLGTTGSDLMVRI